MKTIQYILALTILLLSFLSSDAQFSYDYEYETGSYSELTGATVITVPEDGYYLDLDKEKFLCYSEIYEADGQKGLIIKREGSFQLKNAGTTATFLFSGGFVLRNDTEISYKIEGEKKDTNRVVKVQYEKIGFNYGEANEFMNFQIWIYPNTGDFEAHVGSYLVNTNGSSYSTGTSAWGPATGVIRMDTLYNFLNIITLSEDPAQPSIWRGDFRLLGDTPVEGATLKFKNQAEPIDHTTTNDDDEPGDDGNGGDPGSWPVGVKSPDQESTSFFVYPNPASNYVHIGMKGEFIKGDPILMDVYSSNGALVKHLEINQPSIEGAVLDVSSLSQGIYFIRDRNHSLMSTSFVVNR